MLGQILADIVMFVLVFGGAIGCALKSLHAYIRKRKDAPMPTAHHTSH